MERGLGIQAQILPDGSAEVQIVDDMGEVCYHSYWKLIEEVWIPTNETEPLPAGFFGAVRRMILKAQLEEYTKREG